MVDFSTTTVTKIGTYVTFKILMIEIKGGMAKQKDTGLTNHILKTW